MNQIAVADSAAEGGMRSDDSQVGILGIGGENELRAFEQGVPVEEVE